MPIYIPTPPPTPTGKQSLTTPTFEDLIDEVLTNLHGFTSDLEQLTHLKVGISSTDTTLQVDDATQVTRGLIEIGSELMWVTGSDTTNNLVTVAPFGRGYRSTSAASHDVNVQIMNNPRFPRKAVQRAIQETLYAIYPDIYALGFDESNTVVPVQRTYPLPADVDQLRAIQFQTIGPSLMWQKVRRWRFDPQADTTAFSHGKSVDIIDDMPPGRTIKVTYLCRPGQLVNETDTLSSTGLLDSCADVLVYGACYRLLVNLEASRLQTSSIEQSEREMLVQPGAASNASKYYLGLYTQAMQREVLRLQKLYPNEIHLVR